MMWKWLRKQIKSNNKRTCQKQSPFLEALEPRLLLNGDPIVGALSISPAPSHEGEVVTLEVSFTDEAALGAWSAPTEVPGFTNTSLAEYSPFVTNAGMYFTRYNAVDAYNEMFFAAHGATQGTFETPVQVNIGANVDLAWVSEATDRMYYYYGLGTTRQIEAAVRDAAGNWWNSQMSSDAAAEEAKLVNINALGDVGHPGLTSNELTIVFAGSDLTVGGNSYGGWNLFTADRLNTGENFGNIRALETINALTGNKFFPKVSADGLSLVFSLDNQEVMIATRATLADDFTGPTHVTGSTSDIATRPSFGPDGQTLYMSKLDTDGSYGIYQSTAAMANETHNAAIDWDGDSVTDETLLDVSSTFATQHTYADNGAYNVTVTITDSSENSGSNSALHNVDNVAPLILDLSTNATMNDEVASGETTTLSGTFTDPGKLDTYTVTVNWGDESSSVVDATRIAESDIFSFSATHPYADGGLYTATVTVVDNDGGTGMLALAEETVIIGVGIQNRTLNIVGANGGEAITIQAVDTETLQVDVLEKDSGISQTYQVASDVDWIDVYGRGGSDMIAVSHALSHDTNLDGGADADLIFGGQGADNILGGDGDDKVFGRAGNDTVDGGLGNDLIWGNYGDDTLYGGDGNDKISGGLGLDILYGGTGNDIIWGRAHDDSIFGGDGDDILIGGDGDDYLEGQDGNDWLDGGNGNDVILGGEGDDVILGGAGDDMLLGEDGQDLIFGGSGADEIDGGNGDDIIFGGPGDDDIADDPLDTVIDGWGWCWT